jgi:hypothetical protein
VGQEELLRERKSASHRRAPVHRVIGTDPITNVYGVIGYRVDGFKNIIPAERRYDSEDGLTWIFSDISVADEYPPEPMVYCLFTNEGS